MSITLNNDPESLNTVRSPYTAEDYVTELLPCSQNIEARFGYNLREQFQMHIRLGRLQTALPIHFGAR